MLPHITRPCKSKKLWPGWQHSAACTAPKISSKFKKIIGLLLLCSKFSSLWFVNDVNNILFLDCYSLIYSGIAWTEFLNSNDNLGDILTHIREGNMKGAQLLWLRYEVNDLSHAPTRPTFVAHL